MNYDFTKPHVVLKGQTPAQRAGIDAVKGRNKWMDLFWGLLILFAVIMQ